MEEEGIGRVRVAGSHDAERLDEEKIGGVVWVGFVVVHVMFVSHGEMEALYAAVEGIVKVSCAVAEGNVDCLRASVEESVGRGAR